MVNDKQQYMQYIVLVAHVHDNEQNNTVVPSIHPCMRMARAYHLVVVISYCHACCIFAPSAIAHLAEEGVKIGAYDALVDGLAVVTEYLVQATQTAVF